MAPKRRVGGPKSLADQLHADQFVTDAKAEVRPVQGSKRARSAQAEKNRPISGNREDEDDDVEVKRVIPGSQLVRGGKTQKGSSASSKISVFHSGATHDATEPTEDALSGATGGKQTRKLLEAARRPDEFRASGKNKHEGMENVVEGDDDDDEDIEENAAEDDKADVAAYDAMFSGPPVDEEDEAVEDDDDAEDDDDVVEETKVTKVKPAKKAGGTVATSVGAGKKPLPAFGALPEDNDEPVELEYDDVDSMASSMQDFPDLGHQFGLDEEEQRLLAKLQPTANVQKRNLADIIMEKIREQQEQEAENDDGTDAGGKAKSSGGRSHRSVVSMVPGSELVDTRVRKVYIAIGGVLKMYTSGKIPKAFKVLPHLKNWETLLFLTKPHEWSPHATYAATRIFAAHLNEKMAQRFYSAVLLPIVHEALNGGGSSGGEHSCGDAHCNHNHGPVMSGAKTRGGATKALHPSLYMAIRKALFKSVAFYKGFLLPLCEEGECTLREALVIGSVLQKTHLPPIPTAVVIARLCTLPFSSAICVFLRVFIDKQMALPMQCLCALVKYFHQFSRKDKMEEIALELGRMTGSMTPVGGASMLPVLWHQTFLVFLQRYKLQLEAEQLELMKQVCTAQFHHLITPEARRELSVATKELALRGGKPLVDLGLFGH